jgi:hypothetical protein
MSFEPTRAQREFIAVVAKLTSPLESETAAKALMAMLPTLADLPAGVFCGAAAEHVGRNSQRVPSYAQLRRILELWWAVQAKSAFDEIGKDDLSLSNDDRAWLRNWRINQEAGFTAGFSARDSLDLMRSHHPLAAIYLIRTDTQAAQIALFNRWMPREHVERTPEEIEAVERIVGGLRVARPAYQDPERTEEQRSAAFDAQTRHFQSEHGRRPGDTSHEEIARMRADNPLIQASLRQQEIERQLRNRPASDEWWPDIDP